MLTPDKIEEIKKELMGLEGEEQQKKLQEILAELSPEEREQLVGKQQQQCPFCLMAEGKIPVKTVYEDDEVMAILDINPATKGHTLVFPKEHAQIMGQVNSKVQGKLFTVANKVAAALFDSIGAEGTNVVLSNGAIAGQTSPHVLLNVIARFKDDGVAIGWQPKKADEGELEKLAEEIKGKLPKEVKPVEIKTVKEPDEEHPRIP